MTLETVLAVGLEDNVRRGVIRIHVHRVRAVQGAGSREADVTGDEISNTDRHGSSPWKQCEESKESKESPISNHSGFLGFLGFLPETHNTDLPRDARISK